MGGTAYRHLLYDIPEMPESIIRNLWELENFASNLFERQVKQMMLDTFFKKEYNLRPDYSILTMTLESCSVYLKACVFSVF
jgi:hypothetical protein